MPRYVVLMNLTQQGVKNIKEAPARVEEARKALEAAGGKLLDFYLTMGPYDYVAITEGPSDEAAMVQLFGLGAAGNVRTTTLKAFTLDEFTKLLEKLP
jgi:uncharacterized protein with GYD domain